MRKGGTTEGLAPLYTRTYAQPEAIGQCAALGAGVLTVYDGVIVGTPVGKSDGTNVGQLVEETAGQYKVGGSVGVADGLALGTNVGGAVRVGT
jgi:hypothetical protein